MIHIENINITIGTAPRPKTKHEFEVREHIQQFVDRYKHSMTVADMMEHLRLDPEINALYPNN